MLAIIARPMPSRPQGRFVKNPVTVGSGEKEKLCLRRGAAIGGLLELGMSNVGNRVGSGGKKLSLSSSSRPLSSPSSVQSGVDAGGATAKG